MDYDSLRVDTADQSALLRQVLSDGDGRRILETMAGTASVYYPDLAEVKSAHEFLAGLPAGNSPIPPDKIEGALTHAMTLARLDGVDPGLHAALTEPARPSEAPAEQPPYVIDQAKVETWREDRRQRLPEEARLLAMAMLDNPLPDGAAGKIQINALLNKWKDATDPTAMTEPLMDLAVKAFRGVKDAMREKLATATTPLDSQLVAAMGDIEQHIEPIIAAIEARKAKQAGLDDPTARPQMLLRPGA